MMKDETKIENQYNINNDKEAKKNFERMLAENQQFQKIDTSWRNHESSLTVNDIIANIKFRCDPQSTGLNGLLQPPKEINPLVKAELLSLLCWILENK